MAHLSLRKCALLVSTLLILGTSAGCPKLNRGSGPNSDPFFSIPDNPSSRAGAAALPMGGIPGQGCANGCGHQ